MQHKFLLIVGLRGTWTVVAVYGKQDSKFTQERSRDHLKQRSVSDI